VTIELNQARKPTSRTLQAGAARRVINPRLGTGKPGLRLFGDPIQSIESDLTATVLVLGDGHVKLAIIAADLCIASTAESADLRDGVAGALGIPRSHVMLNLSHAHSSPALPGFMWMTDLPDEAGFKQRYRDDLARWLVEAAVEADAARQPARIGTGWGKSTIGVYRREVRNGQDFLGEDTEHPIDTSVGVIRVDDLDARPIAVLFRYSAHPVTVGPRSVVASTDYPGPAREVVERCLGGLSLFLQGCGGNVNPAAGIGYEVDCADTKDRVGTELGGEVLKVAAGIRTNRRAGPRTTFGTVPNILVVPWEYIDGPDRRSLAAIEDSVSLEFGELPTLEHARSIHSRWTQTLAERLESHAQEWEIRVAKKYANWSRILVEAVEDGHPVCALGLQAIRVGDVVIVGIAAEAFFETGLEIRDRSSQPDTFVLGYTNGIVGYLPRAEDHPADGWQVEASYALPDLIPQAWELPVAFRPDSAARTVDAALALVARLRAEAPA
jgi:hypothetical protein